jgi:DNA (cytosine-5)-methyltransferase 1
MTAPLILDLFAGAGLVADGLIAAGCRVVGVDLHPMKSYPGPFIQADALTLDPRFIAMFDGIWASPPCLRDTAMRHAPGAKGVDHPELITPTRAMLKRSGLPYVIENVETAALHDPVVLCGSMFDLGVTVQGVRYHLKRHRKFEANFPVYPPNPCAHASPIIGVYGGHARVRAASAGGRGTADFVGVEDKTALMRAAMGVTRPLTGAEVSQGVPPIYSRWIAILLRQHLDERRKAA